MRDFWRIDRRELILFGACALGYIVIWALWTLVPLNGGLSLADSENVAAGVPLLGDLPTQSVSKLVMTAALYLMAAVYAIVSIASSPHRRWLPQFAGIGALTWLAWMALNFWIVSGFLNSPAALIYGALSVVLLVAWAGAMGFFAARLHDPMAFFMVRLGLGLAMFVTIVQVISTLTPEWRSPTQGIPVLYTMTLNALVGVFIAGIGGNMLWRERRAQVLAAGGRRR